MIIRLMRYVATLTLLILFKNFIAVLSIIENKKPQSVEWLCGRSVLTMSFKKSAFTFSAQWSAHRARGVLRFPHGRRAQQNR